MILIVVPLVVHRTDADAQFRGHRHGNVASPQKCDWTETELGRKNTAAWLWLLNEMHPFLDLARSENCGAGQGANES